MEMNVLYSCDNAYVPQTLVSMLSLLDSNRDEDVRIFLAGDHLTDENRKMLDDKLAEAGGKLTLLELESILDGRVAGVTDLTGRHVRTVYAKLFAAAYCNSKILLYLDSDTVVAGSLRALFDEELTNDLAAGVRMPYSEKKIRTLFQEDNTNYICDGVVLMNVEAWRKENVEDHCIRYINKFCGNPPMLSEGVLNHVCRGRIKVLEPKYNVMPHMFFFRAAQIKSLFHCKVYYSEEQILEARERPVIIHYLSELFERPWCEGSDHPEKGLYYYYCRLGEIEPVVSGRSVSTKTKLTKLAFKYLPFPLVRLLRKMCHPGGI